MNPLSLNTAYVNTNSSQFARFKQFVDQAAAGHPGYNIAAMDPAFLNRVTPNSVYATLALSMVEAQVVAAETAIAAGHAPDIAGDSYLNAGPMLADLAVVFAWLGSSLSSTQKSRYIAYADQVIFNIWNHNAAKWGNNSFPWSGWCASPMDPGDNYFYSFLTASALWALASQNATQLAFVQNTLMPALENYFAALPDGGSLEGTGYGASHKNLFWLYQFWTDSGFTLGPNCQAHVTASIKYWLHATVPALNQYAPIGDLSRESLPELFDYHRQIMLEARHLTQDDAAVQRADFWLTNVSVRSMSQGFEYRFDLLPTTSNNTPPSEFTYFARGVGHVFSRNSWTADSAWMYFVAGTLNQSHEGHQQGAFAYYKNGWLSVDGNIWSRSGIQQSVKLNNVLRFEKNGAIIEQVYGNASQVFTPGTGGDLHTVAHLDSIMPTGYGWTRTIDFTGGSLKVLDTYAGPAESKAIFQAILPSAPTINGRVAKCGILTITVLQPANAVLTSTALAAIDPDFGSGYRLDIAGGTGVYEVSFSNGTTAPPPPPPPVNQLPIADFTIVTNGLSAAFTDMSSDPDGTISTRAWNFGDGVVSSEINPTHTYTMDGTFTVVLTVTDNSGGVSTKSKQVTVAAVVTPPPPPPPPNQAQVSFTEVGRWSVSGGGNHNTEREAWEEANQIALNSPVGTIVNVSAPALKVVRVR